MVVADSIGSDRNYLSGGKCHLPEHYGLQCGPYRFLQGRSSMHRTPSVFQCGAYLIFFSFQKLSLENFDQVYRENYLYPRDQTYIVRYDNISHHLSNDMHFIF